MTGCQFWQGSVAATGAPSHSQQAQCTLFYRYTGERAADMVP